MRARLFLSLLIFIVTLNGLIKFLPLYNGVSLYDHKPIDHMMELDACFTGLEGRWNKWIYHLRLECGFRVCAIVHLEMINNLLAVRLFAQ